LHTPALQTGTHFLLTLETIVFLFRLLRATSKPFSSLSTTTRSAFGVLFTKTRYTNSVLYCYIYIKFDIHNGIIVERLNIITVVDWLVDCHFPTSCFAI